MFKFLKKLNEKYENFIYRGTAQRTDMVDSFAFNDDEEKRDVYDQILDQKRWLYATNPFVKLYIFCVFLALIGLIGLILYYYIFVYWLGF